MKKTLQWIRAQRNSTRLGFVLQTGSRISFALLSLVWTPLLLGCMGRQLNGLFLSFQALTTMGGLGDLGMGGYVNIQTSRYLGQGKNKELQSFLAVARGVFALISLVVVVGFLAISPWLLPKLRFDTDPGVGALPLLSIVGAVAVAFLILNSFTNNLNYGCGNVTWPIIPTFLAVQMATLSHWLLARGNAPLWLQYVPYVAAAGLVHSFGWYFLKVSHPTLATLMPLNFRRDQFLSMIGKSFWVYLYSVPVLVHLSISRLLIAGAFDPGAVTNYAYNNRLAELAMFVVTAASLASLPKITQWLASAEPATRERAVIELIRLNKFQTLLGCCAVLIYLNFNDLFIQLWLGKDYHAPIAWQAVFAGFLGITAGCLMGFDLAARCCEHGIRVGGIATLCSTFLNLGICWIAVKHHSIFGIALASLITQSSVVLFLGWFSSRQLRISWWHLSLKNWMLGMVMVGAGLLSRYVLAGKTGLAIPLGIAVNLLAVWLVFVTTGITRQDLRHEKIVFFGLLGKRSGAAPKRTDE